MSTTGSVLSGHRRVVATLGFLLLLLVLAVGDVAAFGDFIENGVGLISGP